MVKRRSLDDALSPEEQAFLNKGMPAEPMSKAKPKPKPKQTTRKEEPPMAKPALKQEFIPQAPMPAPAIGAGQSFTMAGVVSLNVRIEPEISTALLRASMERKIQRLDPFTQRDIVAEALALWLKANGYLQ
ncbi:hypothetical protein [Prosthecobacter sp.]|uniref:hypothetical protein n=1 Tax=Prosthecobacter sp. TaxID=1965333 RepID=UPI003782DC70